MTRNTILLALLAFCGCAVVDDWHWQRYRDLEHRCDKLRDELRIEGGAWEDGDFNHTINYVLATTNGAAVYGAIKTDDEYWTGQSLRIWTNAPGLRAWAWSSPFTNEPWGFCIQVGNDDSIKEGRMSEHLYNTLTETFWWIESHYIWPTIE